MYYDDNFGEYESSGDPDEDRQFYEYMQENSVWKRCRGCDRKVKIKSDYAYCNSCATKRERGWDF